MNIDYSKLVQLLLPTFLRKEVLIELVRTMIWPLLDLSSRFNLWADSARYKANMNASVIALERHIQRELDVLAVIEEMDGKPIDFLVNVSGIVEEHRLKSLIDQYKLAGRSFAFRIGSVAYSCSFINHVCEDIIELYSVEFTDHVCEDDGGVYLSAYITPTSVVITASKNVMSEISMLATISGRDGNGDVFYAGEFEANFIPGDKTVTVAITLNEVTGAYYFIEEQSVHILPDSDSYYTYTYKP